MSNKNSLINTEKIISITPSEFTDAAISLFNYQHTHNIVYRQFCDALRVNADKISTLSQIPFLPISFFKSHRIQTGEWNNEELLFQSSGTTGEITSKHFVKEAALYEQSLQHGFTLQYGAPSDYAILALLPSYLERKNASLVYMAQQLMKAGGHPDNGFYINEWDVLKEKLQQLIARQQKVILLGVTFALLDFAERYPMPLHNVIVMETGGMKGRKEEWTRAQVHNYLKKQWELHAIHSEYGMTELLSQAYAKADGIYTPTNTMQVMIRDVNDPLDVSTTGSGCINIIDLANIHSCAFIATEDIGKVYPNGTFEIMGRMDHSALRGCSLMAV